ncbi:hypothetical protein C8J56DRAFT_919512 [Mycena floridula]|nr:hypothetical protein C8J56DRAFT_919512 [Mycena floridula]
MDPKSQFWESLSATYVPILRPLQRKVVDDRPIIGHFSPAEDNDPFSGIYTKLMQEPIYRPGKKWAWLTNHRIRDVDSLQLASSSSSNQAALYLKAGIVGQVEIKYVSKSWRRDIPWNDGFFTELALFKSELWTLQGSIVPTLINVVVDVSNVSFLFEPPHHSFWIEASVSMPLCLKRACVDAYKKLHAKGILHGAVELGHILIGADAKVTLVNFEKARGLRPNEEVYLHAADPTELELEMRIVLVKLDFPGAVDREQKLSAGEGPLGDPCQPIPASLLRQLTTGSTIAPRRFVVPNQSVEELQIAIQTFSALVDKLQRDESCPGPSPSRSEYQPVSSGKKRRYEDDLDSSGPRKRPRLEESILTGPELAVSWITAVAARQRHTDRDLEGCMIRCPWAPAPSVRLRFGKELQYSNAGLEIEASCVTQCDALGLPHPVLLARHPGDPRWRASDAQVYCQTRLKQDLAVIDKALTSKKDVEVKLSRLPRGLGNLKRTFHGIQREEKRKRGEDDDETDNSYVVAEPDSPNGLKFLKLSNKPRFPSDDNQRRGILKKDFRTFDELDDEQDMDLDASDLFEPVDGDPQSDSSRSQPACDNPAIAPCAIASVTPDARRVKAPDMLSGKITGWIKGLLSYL